MNIQEGQIVEFLEGGRFVVAACLGTKGTRYHLVTHLGREVNLSRNRFIHVSSKRIKATSREEIIERLRATDKLRDTLKEKLDIKEVWELLEDEHRVWNPREFSEIIFGKESTPDHEAAAIRTIMDERIHFRFKDGLIHPQSSETVARVLEQKRLEEERQKRLEEGASLLKAIWNGERPDLSRQEAAGWIDAIKDYCIFGEESNRANEVKDLFKRKGMSYPYAPFDTLVRAGIWSEDENLELARAGLERGFPEEALLEAMSLMDSYYDRILDDDSREDLVDLEVFTIDAEESRDLDDGLSIVEKDQGFEVGIHITDVGSLVRPGTVLFDRALERATSLYLPDEIIPMLPDTLSNEVFSLLPGRKRGAFSFFALLKKDGEILSTRVVRSIIQSKERISYKEADQLLEKRGVIRELYQIADTLQKRRLKEGKALPLPIPKLTIRVEDGEIHVWLDEPGPGRFLISEFMILANYIAARFLKENQIPALYRSQPEPKERIIEGKEQDLRMNFRQRRLISRGILGTIPDFHSGLGLECYTTVTSPIRRALDLVMQIQIIDYLKSRTPALTKKALDDYSITIQQGLMDAATVRQARHRYWLLKYLAQRKGEDLEAWILDVLDTKVLVVLKDYLIVVELPREQRMEYHLDQEVLVRIKKVNPRENQLKFEWVMV